MTREKAVDGALSGSPRRRLLFQWWLGVAAARIALVIGLAVPEPNRGLAAGGALLALALVFVSARRAAARASIIGCAADSGTFR